MVGANFKVAEKHIPYARHNNDTQNLDTTTTSTFHAQKQHIPPSPPYNIHALTFRGCHVSHEFLSCVAEYGCMVRIREKSDVYSFGVVLLEIITGKRPIIEASIEEEEGQHVIGWVRQKLKSKRDPIEIVDSKLQGVPDTQIQEMLQALGIALLCTSQRPHDRPTMKDVAALLREIRPDPSLSSDLPHKPPAPTTSSTTVAAAAVHALSPKTTPHPSSFSSSSALSLLQSSSHNSLALYHLPPT